MSRKGKMPIALPKGVDVITQESLAIVQGPKGKLSYAVHPHISVVAQQGTVHVTPSVDNGAETRRYHGLVHAMIHNMIKGVYEGFKVQLELVGVGFRAQLKGNMLDLQLGFSHPTEIEIPQGIKVEIEKNTLITISGIDKQQVGQFAASIRALKKPEVYQGKGIKYTHEIVRRKAGKKSKK